MQGRSQGISRSAFFVPTPNLRRLEFFSCSDSCMHHTKISLPCVRRISEDLCCVSLHSRSDRFLLLLRRGSRRHEHLQILAADERLSNRRTSQHDFLPQPLQCRGKKSSLTETKQLPDDQGQQALLNSSLSYPKEINYICWNWRKKTRPGRALIEGSLSLLSGNHGRNTPQHTPEKAQDTTTLQEFPARCGSNREMSWTQQHKLWRELHIYRSTGLKPLQLLLQLSHLFSLRLVQQMCCNGLEHQRHRVDAGIRLVLPVHG